ncbi:MAG: hypothetical protein M0R03_23190 [Novosphingobium sp.]|nr:hypothetical protein [Novosphingobium sp.]
MLCGKKNQNQLQEIKDILFPSTLENPYESFSYYDSTKSTFDLSQTIFNETKGTTNEQIKEFIRNQYSYWCWNDTDKGKWFSKGYKADETLCRKYEIEYKETHEEEKVLKELQKEYSIAERDRILRKRKLERVLYESTFNEYEKNYLELLSRLETIQDILWRGKGVMEELVEDSYNKFMNDHNGKFISLYEFSDNDGQSVLEHGGVFKNVEHFIISNH